MRISDNLMTNFPCADLNHQKMRNKMESVRAFVFAVCNFIFRDYLYSAKQWAVYNVSEHII